jgi:hypothetical protein
MRGLSDTLALLGGAGDALDRARTQLRHMHSNTTAASYTADSAVVEVRQAARLRMLGGRKA